MVSLNLESIQKALQEKNFDAKIQSETEQVYSILKIGSREFPLFLRVFSDAGLLQMIAFLPCQIKEETKGDVARLLHLFNKELDIPGFGMDEVSGVTFFRCMIPSVHQKVDTGLFDNFLHTVEVACKTFSPTVEAIASGAVDFEEMLKKAKEASKK